MFPGKVISGNIFNESFLPVVVFNIFFFASVCADSINHVFFSFFFFFPIHSTSNCCICLLAFTNVSVYHGELLYGNKVSTRLVPTHYLNVQLVCVNKHTFGKKIPNNFFIFDVTLHILEMQFA